MTQPDHSGLPDLPPSPALVALNAALLGSFGVQLATATLHLTRAFSPGDLEPWFLIPLDAAGAVLLPIDLRGISRDAADGTYRLPDGDAVTDVVDDSVQRQYPVQGEQEMVDALFAVKGRCGFDQAEAWVDTLTARELKDGDVIDIPLLHRAAP